MQHLRNPSRSISIAADARNAGGVSRSHWRIAAIVGLVLAAAATRAMAQADAEEPVRRAPIRVLPAKVALPPRPGTTPSTQPPAAAEATTEAPAPATAKPPIDPKIVRLHMSDGSIISGKLSISDLVIDTKFGRLSVPIEKIRYVKPGLDSRPKAKEQVDGWVTLLGSDSADERKRAAADLFAQGPAVRAALLQAVDGASPRQAAELKTLIDRLNETIDAEFADPVEQTTLDVVATTEFTITGKLVPQSLQLDSDFGTLNMSIEDLVKADRDTGDPTEESRSLAVTEDNFVAKTLKSSGLRVSKGDKIIIRASGQITMSRWGPNAIATPEGASNTGWYQSGKIYNGALIFRIGTSGAIIKAGSAITYTATEAGILHFGIAMNPRYGINDGISYPGQFKVDVKVIKK